MYFSGGYRVLFEDYTKRHFVKDFEKKYKGAWLTTRKAIVAQLRNVDMLIGSRRIPSPIHFSTDRKEYLIKHDFAIAGLHESPRGSGRRIIAYVNELEKVVRILLIYHKTHVPKNLGETVWWETTVKNEFRELLKNLDF